MVVFFLCLIYSAYLFIKKNWKNKWCNYLDLCDMFPSLFVVAKSKDDWVADEWDSSSKVGGWNSYFLRSFNDWKVEFVGQFIATIQGKRVT